MDASPREDGASPAGESRLGSRCVLVGYVRVSTTKQAEDGVSLSAQRRALEAYASAHGLEIAKIYEEAESGGKAATDRPELDAAIRELASGRADGLMVAKLDRLSRSVQDGARLIEMFRRHDWRLIVLDLNIDTKSPTGELMANVHLSVSQWERRMIGERTKAGLAEVKAQGGRIGRAPFGWRHGDERDENGRRILIPVPSEQATLERMKNLRAQGFTIRQIAETLNDEDRPTKRCGRWHPCTVHRILSS